MALPARRTTKTIAHTGVVVGLTVLLSSVFGGAGELIILGVVAVVAIVFIAYVLSHP